MPTFIKTGYWDKLSKAPKGYLNLDDVIKSDILRSVTKTEFDALVASSSLVPGEFYEISGVDVNLYGGTTIIMQAVTNNKLGIEGFGVFYNPKYNQDVAGYGIWANNYSVIMSAGPLTGGSFNVGDTLTAANGAVATLITASLIQYVSGDWLENVNFPPTSVDNGYGVSGNIIVLGFPTYVPGGTVIWGGKHWKNLTGEAGTALDSYSLDSVNWEVIPYNSTDYNVAVDIIKYNQDIDEIFYREDKSGNVVEGYNLNND